MKYFFLFILALILCAAMALSSVLPGVALMILANNKSKLLSTRCNSSALISFLSKN